MLCMLPMMLRPVSMPLQGCSCDQALMNLLPMVNVQPSQIQFGETLVPLPQC